MLYVVLIRFNPCCIGRYAKSSNKFSEAIIDNCFNPCCIGRYAKSKKKCIQCSMILSFNPCCIGRYAKSKSSIFSDASACEFQSLLYWKIC